MTLITLLRIGWLTLKRDRVVQALTFVLPIMFFSIFALVFGNQSSPTSRVRLGVVDEDQTDYSRSLIAALESEGGLRVQRTITERAEGTEGEVEVPLDRERGEALVRAGDLPVVVVLPKGIGDGNLFFDDSGGAARPTVQLLADVSDPVAPQVVAGLLQKVAFTSAPQTMAVEGLSMFEKYTGPLTEAQRQAVDNWKQQGTPLAAEGDGGTAGTTMGLPVEVVNVMRPDEGDTATISFYAAGIGVMFLLFSATGAGGSLLDEEEAGTLDRLIGSRAGMTGVLFGKWVFLLLLGCLQLTVMFTWGALVFGLPLFSHLPGFVVMTIVTAGAASAFGLVLATVSRSRAQLSGMSTIIILSMSAVGGSMFPRFLMSDTMQQMGLVTFNAWALDGYLKVFWREVPLWELWPQVAVLLGLTAVFLGGARRLARRWETT